MAVQKTPSDEDFVKLAQQGTLDAFAALYERCLPMVFYRVRCTIPVEDVEDVTQEVFIAVMKSLKGFRGEARFSTWLRTLTNRQVANYYRRRKQPGVFLDERLGTASPISACDDAIILRQALCKLPEKYREIILLRFAEDMSFNEIAHLNGRSLEATKSLYRRAIAALHKHLKEANA